jgi:hypothetical protein
MARKQKRAGWTPPPSSGPSDEFRRIVGSTQAQRRVPGIIPLVVLLVLGLLCFCMFAVIWSDGRALLRTLRDHGSRTSATVTFTGTDKYGELTNVDVRFTVGGHVRTDRLATPSGSTLPGNLAKGADVQVVYDPAKPSDAMLAEQVDNPPGWTFAMILTLVLGIVLVPVAVAALLVRRRRLHAPRR